MTCPSRHRRASLRRGLQAGMFLFLVGVFVLAPAAWAGVPEAGTSQPATGSSTGVAWATSDDSTAGADPRAADRDDGMRVIQVSPQQRLPLYATVEADGSVSVSHAPSDSLPPAPED